MDEQPVAATARSPLVDGVAAAAAGAPRAEGRPVGGPAAAAALADAYRSASLHDLDMRMVASELEPLRPALTAPTDLLTPWRALSTVLAGRITDPGMVAVIDDLRGAVRASQLAELRSHVDAVARSDPQRAAEEWTGLLADAAATMWCSVLSELAEWTATRPYLDEGLGREAGIASRALVGNRFDQARPLLARLAEAQELPVGVRARLYVLLGQIALFRTEDLPEVERTIALAERLSPDDPGSLQLRADMLSKRVDWSPTDEERLAWLDEALAEQRHAELRARRVQRDIGVALSRRGDLLAKRAALTGRSDAAQTADDDRLEAQRCYREALACEPWEAGHATSLATHLIRTGTPTSDTAVATLIALALALDAEGTSDTQVALANALVERGQLAEARVRLQAALDAVPEDLDAISNFAALLQAEGDLDAADRWLADADDRVRGTFEIAQARAYLAESREMYDVALACHRECLQRRPEAQAAIRADISWVLIQLHQPQEAADEAIAACADLLARNDRHGPALTTATSRLLDAVDGGVFSVEDSLRNLYTVRALRGEAYEPEYRNRRGIVLHEAGRYSEAAEQYRRAIEADPRSAVYRANLALALRLAGDADGSDGAADEAFALDGDAGAHDLSLAATANMRGNAEFESGRYEAAVTHYRRAVQLSPDDPVLLENLAQALQQASGPDTAENAHVEAITMLERAVGLGSPGAGEQLEWARRSLAIVRAMPGLALSAEPFARLRCGLSPDCVKVFVDDEGDLRREVIDGLEARAPEVGFGLRRTGVRFFSDEAADAGTARLIVNGRFHALVPADTIEPVLAAIEQLVATQAGLLLGLDEVAMVVRSSGRADLIDRLEDPEALRALAEELRGAARPGASLAEAIPPPDPPAIPTGEEVP